MRNVSFLYFWLLRILKSWHLILPLKNKFIWFTWVPFSLMIHAVVCRLIQSFWISFCILVKFFLVHHVTVQKLSLSSVSSSMHQCLLFAHSSVLLRACNLNDHQLPNYLGNYLPLESSSTGYQIEYRIQDPEPRIKKTWTFHHPPHVWARSEIACWLPVRTHLT